MEKKKFNITIKNVVLSGFYNFYNLQSKEINSPQANYDIDTSKQPSIEVSFELNPIFTDQGIAEIEVKVLSIKGDFSLYIDIDELDDEKVNKIKQAVSGKINQEKINFEYKLNITETDSDWDINISNLKFDKDGGFEIDYAEIDVNSKTIELA